jgi:ferrous iron transport protein A
MFNRKIQSGNKMHTYDTSRIGKDNKGIIFLSEADKNKAYIIENIFAGHRLTQRLLSIGIVPGEEIMVSDISGGGPITVIVKGIKIALGRGVAAKIALRVNQTEDNE